MGASYILLMTAFYVDNGKNLPLWRELPQIAFWLLPAAIGIPLIARALDGAGEDTFKPVLAKLDQFLTTVAIK